MLKKKPVVKKEAKPGDVFKIPEASQAYVRYLFEKEKGMKYAMQSIGESLSEVNQQLFSQIARILPETKDYIVTVDAESMEIYVLYKKKSFTVREEEKK